MSRQRNVCSLFLLCALASGGLSAASPTVVDVEGKTITLEAGHPSLQKWLLPAVPPPPADNKPTAARIELGKKLFFDPRLSKDSNMSCATCHNPMFGWSDGLSTAKGFKSQVLARATPTIINAGYNGIQMWDGRKKDLEDQATGPMEAPGEMNMDLGTLFKWLNDNAEYRALFAKAYAGEAIDAKSVSKALANYERTVVSNTSRFDRWVRGDKKALNAREINGFAILIDPKKGNCAVCHSGANFTDSGFHNIGLPAWGKPNPDVGRYASKPIQAMKGAFKTPTLRDIDLTAPYFHDGSVATLDGVVEHYAKGGEVRTNLSPDMKELKLSDAEKADLVAFMKALTSPTKPTILPALPR